MHFKNDFERGLVYLSIINLFENVSWKKLYVKKIFHGTNIFVQKYNKIKNKCLLIKYIFSVVVTFKIVGFSVFYEITGKFGKLSTM